MNCANCSFKRIELQGHLDFKNDPYKYTCEVNGFESLPSTDKHGMSLNIGSRVYYTEDQLNAFVLKNRRKICWRKLLNNDALSLSIAGLALLISVYASFFKQEVFIDDVKKDYIDQRVLFLMDSLKIVDEMKDHEQAIIKLRSELEKKDSASAEPGQ